MAAVAARGAEAACEGLAVAGRAVMPGGTCSGLSIELRDAGVVLVMAETGPWGAEAARAGTAERPGSRMADRGAQGLSWALDAGGVPDGGVLSSDNAVTDDGAAGVRAGVVPDRDTPARVARRAR